MFMSFFLQWERNEGFWGTHSRISPYSDSNGVQRVEGPDVSFSAASKTRHDPSRGIRVLSRQTSVIFKKNKHLYTLTTNARLALALRCATHYVIMLERSRVT